MATIAIDFDETLYSFDSEVREELFELAIEHDDKSILRLAYSINHEWRNLVDHDKKTAYRAIERVHERADKQIPFKGAVRVVNRLSKKHDILYIGTRFEKHHDNTENFLVNNGFPDGTLVCANPTQPKNNFLGDCQYLIDDRPKTIIDFLYDPDWSVNEMFDSPARLAFGLWRPYNQNLTDIRNVLLAPTWRGIEYYLERKGIL